MVVHCSYLILDCLKIPKFYDHAQADDTFRLLIHYHHFFPSSDCLCQSFYSFSFQKENNDDNESKGGKCHLHGLNHTFSECPKNPNQANVTEHHVGKFARKLQEKNDQEDQDNNVKTMCSLEKESEIKKSKLKKMLEPEEIEEYY